MLDFSFVPQILHFNNHKYTSLIFIGLQNNMGVHWGNLQKLLNKDSFHQVLILP